MELAKGGLSVRSLSFGWWTFRGQPNAATFGDPDIGRQFR